MTATSLIEKFEAKFTPEPNSGCWLWLGTIKKSGYGAFRIGAEKIGAHRASWLLYRGRLKDEWVLHRCDNPPCVNPDHLFLGDAAANVADKIKKGRGVIGEQVHRAKVTAVQAMAIFLDSRPYKEIAADYGVIVGAITHIKAGRSWGHVTGGGKNPRGLPRGEAVGGSKLTASIVREILVDKRSNRKIADDLGVSSSAISLIKTRKNWRHVSGN